MISEFFLYMFYIFFNRLNVYILTMIIIDVIFKNEWKVLLYIINDIDDDDNDNLLYLHGKT